MIREANHKASFDIVRRSMVVTAHHRWALALLTLLLVSSTTRLARGLSPSRVDLPSNPQPRHEAPNICGTNAFIGAAVIGAVNLSWPGLGAVKAAADANQLGAACAALAAYFRDGNSSRWLRLPASPHPSPRRAGGAADDLVNRDVFHLSGVGQVAKIPRNPDGGLDWLYKGPKTDPEFMNCTVSSVQHDLCPPSPFPHTPSRPKRNIHTGHGMSRDGVA